MFAPLAPSPPALGQGQLRVFISSEHSTLAASAFPQGWADRFPLLCLSFRLPRLLADGCLMDGSLVLLKGPLVAPVLRGPSQINL